MMGERGMYYKKTFFEWSSRVPSIFWAPDRLPARRVSETVSLLDILPTFADIGGVLDQALEMDDCSLVPALTGDSIKDRTVPAEFLAEGVFDPTFLLIKDLLKLFYSEIDPLLLFDLEIDPNERTNQAQNTAYQDELAEMLSIARDSWDAEALKRQIIADQNRLRLIHKAHQIGAPPIWDFQPYTDASQQYVRPGKWATEVEAKAYIDIKPTK